MDPGSAASQARAPSPERPLDFAPTLPSVIRRASARYPDLPFLLGGEARLTFAAADRETALRARGLMALGLGKGARVGLMAPNGDEWVLNWLAAGRMGALVTCLSTFFQVREIDWALRHNDIATLLVSARYLSHDFVERLERALPGLSEQAGSTLHLKSHPYLRRIIVFGDCDRPWATRGRTALVEAAEACPAIDDELLAAAEAQVAPADDLMIVCTSGTTADPKAVVHTHGSAIRNCWEYLPLTAIVCGDRIYSAMPLFWVGAPLCALMPALLEGAAIMFSDTNDAGEVLDLVLRERATVVILGWSVPAFADEAARRDADLSFVRVGLAPAIDEQGALIPPSTRPAGQLGMTETFGVHSWASLLTPAPAGKGGHWGQLLGAVERRIVDPASGAVLPAGEHGELQLRGPTLMRGYYKREREACFTADGFFPTGDHCSLDADGYLYFHGRFSEMIKTSGANVAPREVEAVLASFPEVREAVVFGVPDPRRGEAVAAVVVAEPGAELDVAALQARVRGEISSYKAPSHIVVMQAHEIPRTSTGKPKKRELRDLVMTQRSLVGAE